MKARTSSASIVSLSVLSGLMGLSIADSLHTSVTPAIGFLVGFCIGLAIFFLIIGLLHVIRGPSFQQQALGQIDAVEGWKAAIRLARREARTVRGEPSSGPERVDF